MVPTGSSTTFDFWWKHELRLRFCLNFQDLLGTSLILSAASSKVLSFDQKKMYTWYYFRLIFDVTEFAASGFFAVFEQFDWQRCMNHSTCLICQMFIVQFPRTKTGPTCGLIDVLKVFLISPGFPPENGYSRDGGHKAFCMRIDHWFMFSLLY